MKIIIVENELYLAQSIQNNLSEKLNARCEIYASYNEAIKTDGDIYIINTNLNGKMEPLIEEKKDKIILLLAPYVTHTTVTHPIEIGADDYLQKPFSIESLIRKIIHLKEFYNLKKRVKSLENFIEFILDDIETKEITFKFPLFIKTNCKKAIDKLLFNYAKKNNLLIKIINLNKIKLNEINNQGTIYYAKEFKDKTDILIKLSKFKSVILVPKDFQSAYLNYNFIEIEFPKKVIDEDIILSIENYIKHIILTHQHKFPDTELSRRLGISRKSLWEKRKKYGIFKQK
jgi:hypothetical protein